MREAKEALTKFRSKYPGAYDKYNDSELLGALQKKYPGAYNDLAVNEEINKPENILQRAAKSVQSSLLNTNYGASLGSPFGPMGAVGNQFKREMFNINPEEKLANNDVPGYIADYSKDYFTTPDTYTATMAFSNPIKDTAKYVGKGVGNVYQKGKEIATSGKALKDVNSKIGELDRSLESSIANKAKTSEDLSTNALSQSAKNKGKISSTAKRNTEIYGETLDEIEERLSKVDPNTGKNSMPNRKSYLENVLDRTINEAQEMGLPNDSPVLSKLRSFQARFSPKDEVDDAAEAVDMLGMKIPKAAEQPVQMTLDELRNIKNSAFGKTSSGFKSGASYSTPKDKVSELFLKNHGEFMGGLDEEIGIMNKEFAPYARSRRFGYKAFKPNAPEEVQRGANILERTAGKGKPNKDNLNYLERLEKGSGRFEGTGDLRGNTTKLGSQLKTIDEQIKTLESSKSNLIQKQAKLKELKSLRNKIAAGLLGGGTVTAWRVATD